MRTVVTDDQVLLEFLRAHGRAPASEAQWQLQRSSARLLALAWDWWRQ